MRVPPQHQANVYGVGFVLVWCTGYIVGKYMVADSAPLTALVWRFGLAGLLFGVLAVVAKVPWGTRTSLLHSAVVGLLMLALQFGGVYWGFALGASAGVSALVIGAMPLLVGLVAVIGGTERLDATRWTGMALGFSGVVLVVLDKVDGRTPPLAWLALVVGLVGVAAGTVYQKRHASLGDVRVGLAVQNAAATLVLLPLAIGFEGFRHGWTATFFAPLAWLVLVNSVGGFVLLFLLIRRGAATRVAALFFLMPPVTAVFGHFVLGEHLTPLKLAGFALAAVGVWLATRERAGPVEGDPA